MTRSIIFKQIEKYAQYYPTSLSLKDFIDFGTPQGGLKPPSQTVSMKFLKKEIPVRLANIIKELNHLPKQMLISPSVKQITAWYQMSFEEVINFEETDHEDKKKQTEFTSTLEKIARRHTGVVQRMAEGVIEYRDNYQYDISTHNQIQYFLDRFYMSRISIRMLINQHSLLFGADKPPDSTHIGCVDPNCDVLSVAKDACESAKFLCERYYMTSPPVEYQIIDAQDPNSKEIKLAYVPSHLYHIMFEVLKNAMRAVVEYHKEETSNFDPIKILVCKGNEDIHIRISDRGGGIRRSLSHLLFNYMYSTAPRPMESDSTSAPLAGYGYGLPLSRLYARYLHGDLYVSTLDGYGTDAIITLKEFSSDASEMLPVYNSATSTKYTTSTTFADWSGPFTREFVH